MIHSGTKGIPSDSGVQLIVYKSWGDSDTGNQESGRLIYFASPERGCEELH